MLAAAAVSILLGIFPCWVLDYASKFAALIRRPSFQCLKEAPWQSRLANDALQRAAPQRIVQRNWNCDRCPFLPLLHDPMAATLANFPKTLGFKQATHFDPRKALTRGHTPFQIG